MPVPQIWVGEDGRSPIVEFDGGLPRPVDCPECPCDQGVAVECPYCEGGVAPQQYELIIPSLTVDEGCNQAACDTFSGSWILDFRLNWAAFATCVWYFRDDSLTFCDGSFFSIVLIRESSFANVQIRLGDIGPIILDWRMSDAPDGACMDALEIPQNTELADGIFCLGGPVTIIPVA